MQLKNLFFSALALGTACSAAIAYPNHAGLIARDPKFALVDPVVQLNLTLQVPIKEIVDTIEKTLVTLDHKGQELVHLTAETIQELANVLAPYIEDITDAVESTADYLVDALKKGTAVLSEELKEVAQDVAKALTFVLKKLDQVGQLLVNTLKDELYGLAQAGVFLFGKLDDLVKGLGKAIEGTLEQFVIRANKVGADIDALLGALGKSLGQILHDLLFG
ncbi:hypothetical protein CF327_g332 [Tilletia walkeri]|nr:hypothetical protein CF327_g332 [Tilletia walkeri]